MTRLLTLLFALLFLVSCGSSKKVASSSKRKTTQVAKKTTKTTTKKKVVTKKKTSSSSSKKVKSIVTYAKTFNGTRYKFGGTTKKGMDCSGLVYTSFKKGNITLPRTSIAMSGKGKKVSLKQIIPGDLVFFTTGKNKKRINHVGLVISTKGKIQFIHSSTSRGVMVSSMSERYWKSNFVIAKRIIM